MQQYYMDSCGERYDEGVKENLLDHTGWHLHWLCAVLPETFSHGGVGVFARFSSFSSSFSLV